MQFQNNFDLEEFLAYLLPGFLVLGFVALLNVESLVGIQQRFPGASSGIEFAFLFITLFVTASIVVGHAISFVVRKFARWAMNRVLSDPEQLIAADPQSTGAGKFVDNGTIQWLQTEFAATFGKEPTDPAIKQVAPRLIRAYVFEESARIGATRDAIVRHRSICANLAIALILVAGLVWFDAAGGALLPPSAAAAKIGALLILALILFAKQRDLDIRETKEIYVGFLVLRRMRAKALGLAAGSGPRDAP